MYCFYSALLLEPKDEDESDGGGLPPASVVGLIELPGAGGGVLFSMFVSVG